MTPAEVLTTTARTFGVTVEAIRGKRCGGRYLRRARVETILRLLAIGLDHREIGIVVGRDEATVRYHLREVRAQTEAAIERTRATA